MCIIVLNLKKQISENLLLNCQTSNSDGTGISWIQDGVLTVEKFSTKVPFKMIYERYCEIRATTELPMILHFRIATHGKVSIPNTHPFFVNKKLLFAHNGVLTNFGTRPDLSDTIDFMRKVLRKLMPGFHKHKGTLEVIEQFIGTNKLVFLDNEGNWSIVNEKVGTWDDDTWYSNTTYNYGKKNYNASRNTSTYDADDYDDCNYNFSSTAKKANESKKSTLPIGVEIDQNDSSEMIKHNGIYVRKTELEKIKQADLLKDVELPSGWDIEDVEWFNFVYKDGPVPSSVKEEDIDAAEFVKAETLAIDRKMLPPNKEVVSEEKEEDSVDITTTALRTLCVSNDVSPEDLKMREIRFEIQELKRVKSLIRKTIDDTQNKISDFKAEVSMENEIVEIDENIKDKEKQIEEILNKIVTL